MEWEERERDWEKRRGRGTRRREGSRKRSSRIRSEGGSFKNDFFGRSR